MFVRRYEDGDKERVEEICEITDNAHLEKDLLLTLYCHYYITYEKENCFVAVVDGKVVGYIISAEDTKAWIDRFSSTLLSSSTPTIREKGIESTEGYLPFYPEYPAHLHIDIDGIDFIGDDHKSIYDLGKKEKEISEYHISEM